MFLLYFKGKDLMMQFLFFQKKILKYVQSIYSLIDSNATLSSYPIIIPHVPYY